jgi:hypothetical protein
MVADGAEIFQVGGLAGRFIAGVGFDGLFDIGNSGARLLIRFGIVEDGGYDCDKEQKEDCEFDTCGGVHLSSIE